MQCTRRDATPIINKPIRKFLFSCSLSIIWLIPATAPLLVESENTWLKLWLKCKKSFANVNRTWNNEVILLAQSNQVHSTMRPTLSHQIQKHLSDTERAALSNVSISLSGLRSPAHGGNRRLSRWAAENRAVIRSGGAPLRSSRESAASLKQTREKTWGKHHQYLLRLNITPLHNSAF